MLLTPSLDNPGGLLKRGAHRSAPFPVGIEPDWKFHGLLHHSAGAIVRFLYSLFDAQRLRGQFTDWYQRAPAQLTAERWFTALFAVAQHPRSEEHTSELQSQSNLVCRLLLEKKKNTTERPRNIRRRTC